MGLGHEIKFKYFDKKDASSFEWMEPLLVFEVLKWLFDELSLLQFSIRIRWKHRREIIIGDVFKMAV